MKNLLILFLFYGIFIPGSWLSAQTVTTGTLLNEMIDLNRLACFPDPVYTTKQFSSYDRRSRYPGYPGWFSNSDGFGGEPVPGFLKVLQEPDKEGVGQYLMCDVAGPGAIVRLWTAWIEGEIFLWLDDGRVPVYQGPARKFFRHTYEAMLNREVDPLLKSTFGENTAGYYPIPFKKRCRIVWKGKLSRLHFYHIQVRQYAPETHVKTFSVGDIKHFARRIKQVAQTLATPSNLLDNGLKQCKARVVRLLPGEERHLAGFKGPEAITKLEIFLTARNRDLALRQTLMEIRFDRAPSGQVQTPVGDFFGAAPGINPYESLPFSVFRDGRMLCRYVMPFRDTAEILFRNLGDQEVTVSLKVIDEPYHWVDGSSMYFRARWRVNHEMLADPARVQDIPFLLIRGKGRMVGTAVYIMNPTSVPSSAGNWWGEGDEKIFIDDHLKASFIGTGSEDYFNYAWSSSALFAHAYCGQPRNDGPANRGFVSNYRWHILDNIPFEQSFDFYMELYSHRPVPHFSYGRMIYLYAFPECHDDHMTITGDDVRTLKMPVNWSPRADGWASNSIFYQVEDLLSGHADYTLHESYLWSDGEMMKWLPEHTGDRLNLRIPVSASGNYQIILTAAEMPGFGSIRMLLDGKLLKMNGKEVSQLSSIYQPVSRNFKSGNMALQEGMHVLAIESSDSASGPVGLDFIWIKKK